MDDSHSPPSSPLLDATVKGLPPSVAPLALNRIGERGWNVLREDLPLPLAVLKQKVLEHNSGWMRRFLELSGAKLCPHGKTTMSPQLFQRQLADGAWGITLATIQQVRVAREFGVQRILLANQLLGRPAIEWISQELDRDERFEFFCLVDSLEGVRALADLVRTRAARRPLDVLVEVGIAGKRCGCRGAAAALEVARAAAASGPWLRLRGVEGFEGVITGDTPVERRSRVESFLSEMVCVAQQCHAESLFAPGPIVLTAGGSCFFDLAANGLSRTGLPEVQLVVRSGCYLTHDSLVLNRYYEELLERSQAARELGPGLQPALEVWSYVLTRPEPTRAVLSLGKRDCSFDADLPAPQTWFRPGRDHRPVPLPPGHAIVGLNDQHAMLDLPADSPLRVGDLIGSGISHPCTTFDRWQFMPIVDEDYNVVDGIRTYF
ncbi:MAG: amino acid deaminase [Pirellulales bacterium]